MFKRLPIISIIISLIILGLVACSSSEDLVQDTPVEAEASTESTAEDTASEMSTSGDYTYPIVDTAQSTCYDNNELNDFPTEGEAFYGQDAQYAGYQSNYTDNGDGTVTDNVTGLVWTQDVSDYSMPWSDASGYCESLTTGGIDRKSVV